ncbi:lysophospholipase [Leptospira kobayashii]|uniref:Lysophospholipase n=1 Tax=Leptospira kobayashii TaxID=1917830 RepID=A0ABN6KGL6_9LEPT|nr:alpha/beta hydrolase [Leptospira kobayashii]BDA80383.1 lysophospholipase [Leptospira kobayashii]
MSIWEQAYSREESTFNNKDGGKIYYQVFRPKNGAKRVLVVHHGFGEHGGRYTNLLDAIADKGYVVYLIDARGHGRSEGRRGVVDHYTDFFADLKQLIGIAKQKEGVKKVTLLGHSMGAVISFLYTGTDNNQEDLDGLIVSALAIKVQTDFVMDVKKAAGGFLAKLLPTLTIPAGLDVNMISHDKDVVAAYVNDPLVHGNVSTYLGDFLLNVYPLALESAEKIKVPIYMFHGKDDQIAVYSGTSDAFEKVSSKDKTLKLFDGLYHESMNETPAERALVFKELVAWIDKH